jgi:hypothetical protein
MGVWSALCNTTSPVEKTPPVPTEGEAGRASESVRVAKKREHCLACAENQTREVNTVFANYMKQCLFISIIE